MVGEAPGGKSGHWAAHRKGVARPFGGWFGTNSRLNLQGAICLDTLGTGWSPVGTIKMALISLRMLLESPNPKDPQDAEVAKMLMESPDEFAQKANDWAAKYAGAPKQEKVRHSYSPAKPAEKKKDDPKRWVSVENGCLGATCKMADLGEQIPRLQQGTC